MTLPFTKMHGLGNDFVVVDGLATDVPPLDALRPHLAFIGDRKFGVGFDQFLYVAGSDKADFAMPIFNTDGSEAEMCGNGIRAFAKFVYERGYTNKETITVDTKAGVLTLVLTVAEGIVRSVRVNMGKPRLERSEMPMTGASGHVRDEPLDVDGTIFRLTAVSMGNPHVVYFVDETSEERINTFGTLLENHPVFPKRTNVHEVQVLSPTEIRMLTWERGAGRTLACGTGACASVVACILNDKTERDVLVHLPGGDLRIEWASDDAPVYMTGPATEVFTGEMTL
jgi:diaminopimelate epimerase